MSETRPGNRATCSVCGKPLEDQGQGWRHLLFCSRECELTAARWQRHQISTVVGHAGAGSAAAPKDKGQSGNADEAPAKKPSPR